MTEEEKKTFTWDSVEELKETSLGLHLQALRLLDQQIEKLMEDRAKIRSAISPLISPLKFSVTGFGYTVSWVKEGKGKVSYPVKKLIQAGVLPEQLEAAKTVGKPRAPYLLVRPEGSTGSPEEEEAP